MPRATEGSSIKDTWDMLGMRATAGHDTVLQGAVVPDKYIARVVPAGFAGADLFVLAVFQWALTGFANVYYGLARYLVDLTLAGVKKKTSMAISRSSSAISATFQALSIARCLAATISSGHAMPWSTPLVQSSARRSRYGLIASTSMTISAIPCWTAG